MVSLFALYRRPDDEEAFLSHYRDVHAPLAAKWPGLLDMHWALCPDDSGWYLMAELRFSDKAALKAAMESPTGAEAAHDIERFAKGLLTMRTVEWQ